MLVCWECQNLEAFQQVSGRLDRREVRQYSGGLALEPWTSSDDRAPGLYCAKCRNAVEADLAALELTDDRMDFVAPADFRADEMAELLASLRPDATWSRMEIPARDPVFADVPASLHQHLAESLSRTGRSQLFAHQSEAISRALTGEHVVQATPAGSGKSLGLVLPVLDRLIRDPRATAILLYPLKALANDQLAALERLGVGPATWADSSSFDLRLGDDVDPIRVARYDGSTPEHERASIRRHARLLITTPDSLHSSVLRMATRSYSDGSSWERILRGLRFVVLDELHSYQGVFGSAVGNVLRRLRRVSDHYGATVQFLTASATIGNPRELAEVLTGVAPFAVVDNDGSHGRRRVVLICNPPERPGDAASRDSGPEVEDAPEQTEGGRLAPQTVAIDLLVNGALAAADRLPVRSITFCRSRNAVFQLSQRTRGALKEHRRSDLAGAVAPYAATFLADDRAEAEGKLRDGSTLAIVSTNALELGIDIPDLSLAVLVGYPGQVSSFRQRIGRAGRAGEGVAVLIVGDDPLQQHLARRQDALTELLDMPAETVVVNPSAAEITRRYGLAPAQDELGGIAFEDVKYFGNVVSDWLEGAAGQPSARHGSTSYWRMPSELDDPHSTGLRNAVGSESFTVVHQSGRDFKPVGVVDSGSAPRDAFVPAIWNGPDGTLYRITGFDQQKREIYCEGPVESPFLTRGVTVDRVEVRSEHVPEVSRGRSVAGYGRLEITRQVFSYKEQHFSGRDKNQPVEKGWPPVTFVTDGLYLRIDTSVVGDLPHDGSVRALEHLLLAVAPALVACDPYDIDSTSTQSEVYLYDSFGGDLGLTRASFDRLDELISLAAEVVASCTCDTGCPSCVMLSRRPDGNKDLSKAGAILLLQSMRS
jgi:DEAD/DEAH box helicase domain-containing protein